MIKIQFNNSRVEFILVDKYQTNPDNRGDNIAKYHIVDRSNNRQKFKDSFFRFPCAQVVHPSCANKFRKNLSQLKEIILIIDVINNEVKHFLQTL